MNQSGSYSVAKKASSVANGTDGQFLIMDTDNKHGVMVTPKSTKKTERDGSSERQPFLDKNVTAEPVRLTPAWEDNNLTDDELNFKSVTMDQATLELNPPRDRLNLVYLTLVLHGVGVLMPWNMFITAREYFIEHKLSEEYTGVPSEYATYFMQYITFASQVPNLIFNWFNIFMQFGGNLTTRIVWSIFIEVVMFVLTVTLAMSDTHAWPSAFFWITMVTVVVLNMANGIYQNTVFGMGAKLPVHYTGAIILGSNISGTFTAVINLLAIFFAPNVRTAAIYYFITALFVLLACFDTYFALPLNRYYRYNEYIKEKAELRERRENPGRRPKRQYWQVFKAAFPQLTNVFCIFFVTLAIFPAMHGEIKMSDPEFIVPDKYYVAVLTYLTFNVTAMLGSLVSNWVQWPSPKFLVIPVLLRFAFIPLFVFLNYRPPGADRVMVVLIHNDWVFWAAAILMGFTSGYFSSVAMMYTSQCVEPQHAGTAGMFGGATLITGIFSGVLASMVFPWLVQNVKI